MLSLLLAIIYIAFISLGLPDSLLGSGWPAMQAELGVPLSYAGIVSMLIASQTIVSSLFSDRLTKKFGAGLVTAVSTGMTALALLGFSQSNAFWQLCLWAIPYGLGAGGVDVALNNFVALHYSSRHMNWLHCFWGVGAAISPNIMSFALMRSTWSAGYLTVSLIQIILTFFLFLSLPLWKKNEQADPARKAKPKGLGKILKLPGVPLAMLTFLCYCAAETTAGLWAASFLVQSRGNDTATAATFASLFYVGITFGRFLSGLVSNRLGDKKLIRIGMETLTLGILLILIPCCLDFLPLIGLLLTGLGCAPIYPSLLHQTPSHFGKENSQSVIGLQMASAYTGTTLMPPLFGLIAEGVGLWLYPFYLLAFTVIMIFSSEWLNRRFN